MNYTVHIKYAQAHWKTLLKRLLQISVFPIKQLNNYPLLIKNKPKTNLSEEGLFPCCLTGSALENVTSLSESIS